MTRTELGIKKPNRYAGHIQDNRYTERIRALRRGGTRRLDGKAIEEEREKGQNVRGESEERVGRDKIPT